MTLPSTEPSKQPTTAATPIWKTLKFSKKQLALAFAIAGISDAIGAFATPLPPIVWVVDVGTALLLFMMLGRQWLLLPGLALEAIPGFGVLSIMAAGSWGDCCPRHSSAKFWTALTKPHRGGRFTRRNSGSAPRRASAVPEAGRRHPWPASNSPCRTASRQGDERPGRIVCLLRRTGLTRTLRRGPFVTLNRHKWEDFAAMHRRLRFQ